MASDAPAPPEFSRLILAVAASRDREAFAVLFDHFAPRVKTYMMRLGSTASQADELAQETLLMLWRKADAYDAARATPGAWIYTIARNLRIDRHRKEWRVSTGDDLPDEIDSAATPDVSLSDAERSTAVRAAMAKLAPDQIRVIELSFFEEKPHAEIAQVLDIPLGTVKSRIRIAMQRLRALLGDYQ